MSLHPSIVQRACDVLVFHPECPPMPKGTEGLAYAMEAALEEVAIDLGPEDPEPARRWAVHLEQDAARGRELATAYLLAIRSGASWGETEVAMDRLMEWVEDSDPVEAQVRHDARRGRIQ